MRLVGFVIPFGVFLLGFDGFLIGFGGFLLGFGVRDLLCPWWVHARKGR
jgi:hypothetical protein